MKEIFLDGASNTPLDPDVLKAMKPYLSSQFVGNSSSIHNFGIKADQVIFQARNEIAACLCVRPEEVYFTSGATESNNWAIKSVAYDQLYANGKKKHILCSATEHDSVLNCCKQLAGMGMDVEYIHPHNGRSLDITDVVPLVRPETCLICLMAINNETGAANDVDAIIEYAVQHDIKILLDCTQLMSYGGAHIELGRRFSGATFFSFSAHKIYGPLGVGCLIATNGYHLNPLIIGGGQEQGLRGGTSNTTGIVGMAAAIRKIHAEDYSGLYNKLLIYLKSKLNKDLPAVYFNVWPMHANIISLNCHKVINVNNLAAELASYGIAVSAGSACNSAHDETSGDFNGSHVLKELGLSEEQIRNTIRISFTKYTRVKDIDKLINALKEIMKNAN